MKRPLSCFVLVFSAGIFAASKAHLVFLPVYLFSIVLLLLCFSLFDERLLFNCALLLLIFLSGALFMKNSFVLPASHVANLAWARGGYYTVRGIIDSEPELKSGRSVFVFSAIRVSSDVSESPCCGKVLVSFRGEKCLRYGEELTLGGKLYRPFNSKSGSRSYKDYLRSQGIYLLMSADRAASVSPKNKGLPLKSFSLWLKAEMEKIIFRQLSGPAAGVIDAMILGEKKHILPLLNSSMVRSGTVHILVVSGFNVGIVAFMVSLLLKLARLGRKARFFISICFLVIYCLMTGAAPPVVRATVMAVVFLSAHIFRREADIYNSSALAALFILLVNPWQLFNVSFQLSFASVLSIVYLYPRLKRITRAESLKLRFLKPLAESCLVSLSAWLGTAGLIVFYFKVFSPVTVLANIFIVPLAGLITLCGFGLIFVSLACPPLSGPFAVASEAAVALLINLNALLVKLPGASFQLS